MSEKLQRTESLQPLNEAANGLVQEMGEQPQQRLDWFMQQTGESFGNVLLHVNSTARGLNPEEHEFDGDGVQAGTIGGSIPPDQEDKITLLDDLVTSAQQHITAQTEKGEDPQAIVSELAVALPTVVNKLHLFADGNGRTSRTLRMVLRDGDQITPEKVEALVHKNGYDKYDTTPGSPIETSVLRHMRKINGASEVAVVDDVVDEDTFADEVHEDILAKFPDISPSVVKAYSDTVNFSETVRLMGKNTGVETVSLAELFGQITVNPDELANFTAVYRGVRKQRVELLIGGLTGEAPVPLSVRDKGDDVYAWINGPRKRLELLPIDPNHISTIQDFQTAYCETFSPQRTDISENIKTTPENDLRAALPTWTYQDFKDVLIGIHNKHVTDDQVTDFDADKNIMGLGMAGSMQLAGIYYPRRQDKEELLDYALSKAKEMEPSQAAILLSAAEVAVHPFKEGNGRTSRELYQRLMGEDLMPEADRSSHKNSGSRDYIDMGTAFTEDELLPRLANYWPYYRSGVMQQNLGIVIHRSDIEDEDKSRILSNEAVAGLSDEEETDLRAAVEPSKDEDGLIFATAQAVQSDPNLSSYLYAPESDELVGPDKRLVNIHELLPAMTSEQKKEFVAALWTYRKLRAQASIDFLSDEFGDITYKTAQRAGEISLRSIVTERTNNLHSSKISER